MIIGTLFTLFVLPAIYMLIARDRGAKKPTNDSVPQIAEPKMEAIEV